MAPRPLHKSQLDCGPKATRQQTLLSGRAFQGSGDDESAGQRAGLSLAEVDASPQVTLDPSLCYHLWCQAQLISSQHAQQDCACQARFHMPSCMTSLIPRLLPEVDSVTLLVYKCGPRTQGGKDLAHGQVAGEWSSMLEHGEARSRGSRSVGGLTLEAASLSRYHASRLGAISPPGGGRPRL